jgi:hypothetical protein
MQRVSLQPDGVPLVVCILMARADTCHSSEKPISGGNVILCAVSIV